MARKRTTHSKTAQSSISSDGTTKSDLLRKTAVQLAEFSATALLAAEQLRIKTKPLEHFTLSPAQREDLLTIPTISKSIENRLAKDVAPFTVADVVSMTKSLAEHLRKAGLKQQVDLLRLGKRLIDQLQKDIAHAGKLALQNTPKSRTALNNVYQFKITLKGANPPIWRWIQVEDCTLDKLHEHIQTAMGWTNNHLHRFEIGEKQYADPELPDDGFDDVKCLDSPIIDISDITKNAGKRSNSPTNTISAIAGSMRCFRGHQGERTRQEMSALS